jgi:hypothetical protein
VKSDDNMLTEMAFESRCISFKEFLRAGETAGNSSKRLLES